MSDFMEEPAMVLPDRESVLRALAALDWFGSENGDSTRFKTKSIWM